MTQLESIQIIAALMTVVMFLGWLGQPIIPIRTAKVSADAPKIFKLMGLVQPTSRDSAWRLVRRISIFVSIVLLSLDVTMIVVMSVYGTNVIFCGGMVIFLIVIFMLPIYFLVDDYRTQLRLTRGERSTVYKWAELEVVADYDSLLLRCSQVLSEMGARITNYNAVIGMVLAELPKTNITIEIRKSESEHYNIYIASDSNLPSVKFDFGSNQKNVDVVVKRLLGHK